jgi:hypothetical protein
VARLVLLIGGLAFALAGVTALLLGWLAAEWVLARLPAVSAGPAEVGGATVAIGVALLAVAAVHLTVVAGLWRGVRIAGAAGVLLGGGLAAFLASSAVAAEVQGLPLVAIGLGLAAIAYGAAAFRLLELRRER